MHQLMPNRAISFCRGAGVSPQVSLDVSRIVFAAPTTR